VYDDCGLAPVDKCAKHAAVYRVTTSQSGRSLRPIDLLALAIGAALLADLVLHLRPTNYLGGSSDEQRYLEIALQWVAHGPNAGTTHWALRHPLILAIAASFKAFGISITSLQFVSRIAFDLLVALTAAMMGRFAGLRAALVWTALALVMPVFHQNATNCGPEVLELLFGAASAWAFWEARAGGRHAAVLMILSGACASLALLTRETSACLLFVYLHAWLRGRTPWRGALWFAIGFLPPLVWDNLWLWSQTGQIFYRLHVDESHTHIYSAHLQGGIYQGRVLLNPELASRWVPPGPVKLHWTIDPVLNFFAAPDYGLIFVAWALLMLAKPTRPAADTLVARAQLWLFAIAFTCYVIVTWVLTLRPQPRYYLFAVYAATIAVALLLDAPGGKPASQRIRAACFGLVMFCGALVILLNPDRQIMPRLIVSWLQRHPGMQVHFPGKEDAERMAFPAVLGGVRHQITAAPAPIGGLRFREIVKPSRDGQWQPVETLTGPDRFPYLSAPKAVVLERRVR